MASECPTGIGMDPNFNSHTYATQAGRKSEGNTSGIDERRNTFTIRTAPVELSNCLRSNMMNLRQRPVKTKRNEYVCESCGARFDHSKQLSHHWHDVHANVPKPKHFRCSQCGSGYRWKSDLKKNVSKRC